MRNDYYRSEAERCAKGAADTNDLGLKVQWLELEKQWRALIADAADVKTTPAILDAVVDEMNKARWKAR